ncbi:MAG: four helix bundle protein [Marinoscillum sp.]
MSKIETFEQLECWKSARDLNILIYKICDKVKFKTEFTAKDQLKRAALSSMNNIAEGFGRFSNKEFVRFLNISTASLDEVHSMILLYTDLAFIEAGESERLIELIKRTKYQTLGLIKYLNTKL